MFSVQKYTNRVVQFIGGPADGLAVPLPRTLRCYVAEVITDDGAVVHYSAWTEDDEMPTGPGRLAFNPTLPEAWAKARGRIGDAVLNIDLRDPKWSGEGVRR